MSSHLRRHKHKHKRKGGKPEEREGGRQRGHWTLLIDEDLFFSSYGEPCREYQNLRDERDTCDE